MIPSYGTKWSSQINCLCMNSMYKLIFYADKWPRILLYVTIHPPTVCFTFDFTISMLDSLWVSDKMKILYWNRNKIFLNATFVYEWFYTVAFEWKCVTLRMMSFYTLKCLMKASSFRIFKVYFFMCTFLVVSTQCWKLFYLKMVTGKETA